METLTFDIETIPMQGELSDTIKDEVSAKIDREIIKNPGLADDNKALQSLKNKIMATSPYFGEILTIGLHRHCDVRGSETSALVGDEKEFLTRFWNMLKNFSGTFISFNGLGFDVPFILKRSMYHGIKPTNSDFMDTRRYQRHPHFDVMMMMADWDRFRSPSLQLACEHMGIPSPKDGEVKASEVYGAYQDGRLDEIVAYCKRDVVATFELYKRFNGYYK